MDFSHSSNSSGLFRPWFSKFESSFTGSAGGMSSLVAFSMVSPTATAMAIIAIIIVGFVFGFRCFF